MSLCEGVLLEQWCQKRGTPQEDVIFSAIGSFSVKEIADRYIHAAYYNKHWRHAF